MAYQRRPYKYRHICYSCVTGQPVWLYQGQSSEGMRKAYWRAAKKEQTRARWFQRRTERRTRRIQHLLDECLAAIPILGKLTKDQREAVRRLKVIIAGAGMAAALPGVIAASTTVPVIGVPIKGMLDGLDAMLSIIQMPPGIPVATVGVNGAQNAAILAAEMLALSDEALSAKLKTYKTGLKVKIVKANQELSEVKYKNKVN